MKQDKKIYKKNFFSYISSLYFLILFVVFLFQATGFPVKSQDKLDETFNQYFRAPTLNTAKFIRDQVIHKEKSHLLRFMRDYYISSTFDLKQKSMAESDFNINFQMALFALEKEVMQGQQYALRRAFLLYPLVDGGFADHIAIIISKSIHINPYQFLVELKRHHHLISEFEALITSVDSLYIQDFEEQYNHHLERYKMIKSIKSQRLSTMQNKCLTILEKHLLKMQQANSYQ